MNLKSTQCENHFDTNLIESHSVVIAILSISCCVLFEVTANGGHLGTPTANSGHGLLQTSLGHNVSTIFEVLSVSFFS